MSEVDIRFRTFLKRAIQITWRKVSSITFSHEARIWFCFAVMFGSIGLQALLPRFPALLPIIVIPTMTYAVYQMWVVEQLDK